MTVRDLVELNSMITDICIQVRHDGVLLFDELNIGPAAGIIPRYPTRIPKKYDVALANAYNHHSKDFKDAAYIPKSINSYDDGRDYWQIKINRIPKQWLDLTVYSWEVWPASRLNISRRQNGHFSGQKLNVIALPSGKTLQYTKVVTDKEYEGQLTLADWNVEVVKI